MTHRARLLTLAVTGLLCVAAPTAAAEEHDAAADPGFAVAAVGFESYFKYRLRPGARQDGSVRLVSRSDERVVVMLRGADVTTAATGGLEYGSGKPRANGTWLDVPQQRVVLAPGAAVEVPFRLRVPRDVGPGDHLAGLVAINRRQLRAARRKGGDQGFSLRFLPRLAIAVHTTLPGNAKRGLTVGAIGVDVRPTSTDVTLLIRNTGEKLVPSTGGRLTVRRGDRVLLRREVELDAFVPGTNVVYRLPLTGVPARGSYELSGELLPEGAPAVPVSGSASFGDAEAEELQQETGQAAIDDGPSVLLIVFLVAGAIAIVAMGVALIVLRSRLRRATAASERDG